MNNNDLNARLVDVISERLHNCALCDCVSTSLECESMFELSTMAFHFNSVNDKPRVYLCKKCLGDIADTYKYL